MNANIEYNFKIEFVHIFVRNVDMFILLLSTNYIILYTNVQRIQLKKQKGAFVQFNESQLSDQ